MSETKTGRRRQLPRDILWIAVLACVLIAGGVGWLLSGSRPRSVPPARPIPTLPDDIQVRLGKVRLQGISSGTIVWEVEAEHFDWARQRSALVVGGLKQIALLNKGKVELTLSADSLEQNTMSGRITVSGNVVVQGTSLQITAPTAVWDPHREELQFSRPLVMRFGDFTLTSLGATALDVKAGLLTAKGDVTLETQGSVLRAQSVTANLNERSFAMGGPVAASLAVADINAWAEGHRLPVIPEIPGSIKERYREYLEKKAQTVRPGALPRSKGARP